MTFLDLLMGPLLHHQNLNKTSKKKKSTICFSFNFYFIILYYYLSRHLKKRTKSIKVKIADVSMAVTSPFLYCQKMSTYGRSYLSQGADVILAWPLLLISYFLNCSLVYTEITKTDKNRAISVKYGLVRNIPLLPIIILNKIITVMDTLNYLYAVYLLSRLYNTL